MMKINYNKVSEIYDMVRVGDPIIIKKMIDSCTIHQDIKILDVGCGTGNNTVLLQSVTKANVYGIDQSEGMLEKAKEKNSNINWMVGDALTLRDVPNEEFDIIFMVDVIHHIEDIHTMFKNFYRVLKNNGKVFIFTDSHEHIKYNRLVSRYFPETIKNELKRYQSTEDIVNNLQSNSFNGIHCEDISYPSEENPGEKLLKLAKVKGYSMFHLISQDAIDNGIQVLKNDLKTKTITYEPKTQMILAHK